MPDLFDPNASVQDALQLLARRLDPIIEDRLRNVLEGAVWTSVLEELDRSRGHVIMVYSTSDLQPQLRMITERLGDWGFPFETRRDRIVSTLGSELRIVRNGWAHYDEFSVMDAWRTHDFVCRLLDELGDHEGAALDAEARRRALEAVAAAEGISVAQIEAESTAQATGTEQEQSAIDLEAMARPETPQKSWGQVITPKKIIGDKRLEYEPWVLESKGDVSVLDDLRKRAAQEKVRAVAVEIAEFEGPIHVDRLALLIGRAYGLMRLATARKNRIIYRIKHSEGLFVDDDDFVWPTTIDRGSWTTFRPSGSDAGRDFLHISPVEIANAAVSILEVEPDVSQEELEKRTLEVFRYKRRTVAISRHLKRALDRLGPR